MRKLFLSILLVLVAFTALNVSAALTGFTITGGPTYPTGQTGAKPGDTVSFTFSISNTDAAAVTAQVTSDQPKNGQYVLSAPSIASVSIPLAGTQTGTFSVIIPSTLEGTYSGTLTAKVNASINATASYSFLVNPVTTWEVSGTQLDFSGIEGGSISLDDSSQKITLRNTGTTTITPSTVSEIPFNDTANKKVSLNQATIGLINPGTTKELSYTWSGKVPVGMALGEYTRTATITLGSESKVLTYNLDIHPQICELGPKGSELTLEIKDPDRNDDFKPGDVMPIKVSVKNTGTKDKDVIVEAFLWNIEENSEIASAESDSINIDNNKKEEFDLTLTVPTSESDLGSEDDLMLYIEAYEDGEEENQCIERSVSLDGKRETRDARIISFTANPQITSCNKQVALQVDVENLGKKEDKTVKVSVKNPELELDLSSEILTLDAFDESGSTATKIFAFSIPEDAAEKEYIIEAITTYDSGKKQDSEFARLEVKGCGAVTTGTTVKQAPATETSFALVQKTLTSNPGVIGVPFKIANAEKETKTFTVEVQPQGTWTTASTSNVVVKAGEVKSDFVYVVTDKSLKDGSYTGSLVLSLAGTTIGTESFAVNIGKAPAAATGQVTYQPTGSFSKDWVDSGRIFWILGMIVILVLIIFFIKLIFKQ